MEVNALSSGNATTTSASASSASHSTDTDASKDHHDIGDSSNVHVHDCNASVSVSVEEHPVHTINKQLEAAGEELVHALDNAFAEFDDEDFELDDDDLEEEEEGGGRDSCSGASCVEEEQEAEQINAENDNDDDASTSSQQEVEESDVQEIPQDENDASRDVYDDNDDLDAITDDALQNKHSSQNPKPNTDIDIDVLHQTTQMGITATGTDEELEEELEKRVAEWIVNADSNSDAGDEEEKKEVTESFSREEIEVEDKNKSELINSSPPPRSIHAAAMTDVVSPLLVRAEDFGSDGDTGDASESTDVDAEGAGEYSDDYADTDTPNGDVEDSVESFDFKDSGAATATEVVAENESSSTWNGDSIDYINGGDVNCSAHYSGLPSIPETEYFLEGRNIQDQDQDQSEADENDIDFTYSLEHESEASQDHINDQDVHLQVPLVQQSQPSTSQPSKVQIEVEVASSSPQAERLSCTSPLQELLGENGDVDDDWDWNDVDSLPSTLAESPVKSSQAQIVEPISEQIEMEETNNRTEELSDYECQDQAGPPESCMKDTVEPYHGDDDGDAQQQSASGDLERTSPNDVTKIEELPFFKIQQQRSEDLAHSHAEDVLSLSLEVQTLKAELKKEKEEHQLVIENLKREKATRIKVEDELQERRRDHANAQNTYCDDVQQLMAECQQAKVKIRAAEQDAEEALNLAQDSAKSREEMEGFLQRALDELEQLRSQAQQLPRIVEDSMMHNFSEVDNLSQGMSSLGTPTRYMSSPRRLDRRRAGVSVGRSLLRQSMDNDEDSTQDGSTGSTNTDSSYYITLSRRSAEKRQNLLRRLKKSTEESPSDGDVVVFSSDRDGLDLNYTNTLSKSVKNIANVIRKSGMSLGFGGRWFTRRNARLGKSKGSDEMDMEAMTNNYCKSVELLVAKQKEDLKELKSFCDYLEAKVAES